jgi:hypothetical protein
MVEKDVIALFNNYDTKIERETREYDGRTSLFLTARDTEQSLLSIKFHFLEGKLLSIDFLNNNFTELEDVDLQMVIESILKGRYSKKRTIVGKQYVAIANQPKRIIVPEHIHSSKDFIEVYKLLPCPFTKKA